MYVAVLGNGEPEALHVIELDLSRLPEGTPKNASSEVKWEQRTVAYKVTNSIIPEDLDEQVAKDLQKTALQAYRALELRDYGRIDMRLAADGRVYVLEVNPNPWLHSTAEFAMAAKKAGRDHESLIGEIVDLALARYRP